MATITKRTSSTGKDFWQVQIRRSGYKPYSEAFKTLADAKKFATLNDAKLINNEQINRDAMKQTIKDVIDQFLAFDHRKPITAKSTTRLKYLQHANELGSFTVKTLTPKMLNQWIEARHKINKAPTVYWYYCNLKRAMTWHALTNGYRIDVFETAKCKTTVTARTRRISDDEIHNLHKAIDSHMVTKREEMKWAIEFALNTSMRAGEMVAFKWEDVKLNERKVILDKKYTKTRIGREVPLTSDALRVLTQMKAKYWENKDDNAKRVFGMYTCPRNLCVQFKIICGWAGIDDLSWHVTRHEAVSRFYEKTNLTDVEIASISGHKDVNVLAKHYAHLRPKSLLEKLW